MYDLTEAALLVFNVYFNFSKAMNRMQTKRTVFSFTALTGQS